MTGATDGIGRETAARIAANGFAVIVVARDGEKGERVAREIARETANEALHVVEADLSRQTEVRSAAEEIEKRFDRLDVLVNNAGAIFFRRELSADGIELTFALNHLAPFLLTLCLLDRLVASAPARVVNVASVAHRSGKIRFDDLGLSRGYSAWSAYAQSKLANLLFTFELARRLEGAGVTANALHPGFVRSRFGSGNAWPYRVMIRLAMRLGAVGVEEGAGTSVYLAASPEVEGVSGKYFERCRPVASSAASRDAETARRLWEASAAMVGVSP